MGSVGLGAVVARCGGGDAGAKGGIWEVGVEIGEFWKWYRAPLSELGISMLEEREQRGGVASVRMSQGISKMYVVIGQFKVSSIYCLLRNLCR